MAGRNAASDHPVYQDWRSIHQGATASAGDSSAQNWRNTHQSKPASAVDIPAQLRHIRNVARNASNPTPSTPPITHETRRHVSSPFPSGVSVPPRSGSLQSSECDEFYSGKHNDSPLGSVSGNSTHPKMTGSRSPSVRRGNNSATSPINATSVYAAPGFMEHLAAIYDSGGSLQRPLGAEQSNFQADQVHTSAAEWDPKVDEVILQLQTALAEQNQIVTQMARCIDELVTNTSRATRDILQEVETLTNIAGNWPEQPSQPVSEYATRPPYGHPPSNGERILMCTNTMLAMTSENAEAIQETQRVKHEIAQRLSNQGFRHLVPSAWIMR